MTSTRAHWSWRPAAWLALPWLLAACANVLGIEERKVDSASSYPQEGYEGCRAGDCSGCLEVHRVACQVRSNCAEAAENTDCAGCVCRSCEQEVVACQLDAGCAAIWECLRETRCDLSERAENSCLQACASIVEASGGVTGEAFRTAAEIRSCAASSACLSCLAPQVQQSSRACTQANGCLDCDACFDQCLCSGERYGECQRACPTQGSASTACSEDDACAGCSSCFDACSCGGGSYDSCVDQCTTPGNSGNGTNPDPDPDPDPDPSACTSETSCADCADCVSQCTCSTGNTAEACEGLCAPQPGTDQCRKDPRGVFSSCDGCQSCIAQCTCEGSSIELCRSQCQEAECCGTQGACGSGFGECMCTQTGAACYAQQYGNCDGVEPCETCSCQQCPGERGMCLETPGCQRVFDCMRATSCKGSACLDRCRGSDSPQAFAYAEALWACYRGSECSCGTAPPPSVACPTLQGEAQCAPYVGPVEIQACCSGTNMAGAPVGAELGLVDGTSPCGLQLNAYVRGASACEPREQPSPPRFAERCPDGAISEPPYSGAVLKGCCREDSTCGFFDDVTGLGCLSPKIFGHGESSCP